MLCAIRSWEASTELNVKFRPWKFLRLLLWLFKMRYFSSIYIDTSALIAMPNSSFTKLSRRHFTSSLVLLEIMTNYLREGNVNSFRRMKSRFENIQRVDLRIDWRLTEEIFNSAFPAVKKKKIQAGDLPALYELVRKSQSPEQFAAYIAEKNLQSSIEAAISYDDFLGSGMTRPERIAEFRHNFEQGIKTGSVADFYYKEDKHKPTSAQEFFKDMSTTKLEEGRIFILKSLLMKREKDNQECIPLDGYRYTLGLFLSASAYHLFNKAITQSNYKRNDMIDLFHFAYIDKYTKILTKEALLIEYTKRFQPASLEPFKNYGIK